jgi:uncharacterized protein (DUF1684 family)
MSELEDFRQQKDAFFKDNAHSPLLQEERESFAGLAYFPAQPDLRLELPVEVYADQDTIEMQTSDGGVRSYQRYGRIAFEVEGQEASLTLYRSQLGFFLPFVDALAGKETYPAGRYVEPEQLEDGRFLVDFNYAYNPSCAYNESYSCPMTPFENRLRVPIRAGEKLYHTDQAADEA